MENLHTRSASQVQTLQSPRDLITITIYPVTKYITLTTSNRWMSRTPLLLRNIYPLIQIYGYSCEAKHLYNAEQAVKFVHKQLTPVIFPSRQSRRLPLV